MKEEQASRGIGLEKGLNVYRKYVIMEKLCTALPETFEASKWLKLWMLYVYVLHVLRKNDEWLF